MPSSLFYLSYQYKLCNAFYTSFMALKRRQRHLFKLCNALSTLFNTFLSVFMYRLD